MPFACGEDEGRMRKRGLEASLPQGVIYALGFSTGSREGYLNLLKGWAVIHIPEEERCRRPLG
ncbi:MAG: hypothetical protein V3U90_04235 [Dehalococcoidia bacterium]